MKSYITTALLASATIVSALPTELVTVSDEQAAVAKRYNETMDLPLATRADHPDGAAYLGVYKFDCAKYPESCNNICFAVECLLYFKKKPASLTQTWKPSLAATHRTESGAGDYSCGKGSGQQCDEFPMASMSGGGYGASLSCIDGGDNQGSGSKTKNWVEYPQDDAYPDKSKNPVASDGEKRTWNGAEGDIFDYDIMNVDTKKSPFCAGWKKGLKGDDLGKLCKATNKNQFQPNRRRNGKPFKQPDDYTFF